jgi:hypothetical protein
MTNRVSPNQIEDNFMAALRHHLAGWHSKVEEDFGEESYQSELSNLISDRVYSKFGFASQEYVLVRLMGRLSISIGRRLGEIYDKIPRFATQARFGLSPPEASPLIDGLELDICIRRALLKPEDRKVVTATVRKYVGPLKNLKGVGIEIRYNFNPNDSARLRKDVKMASSLEANELLPVYLIFSQISPRQEAIARLKRAGWKFLVGRDAEKFMNDLIGMDLAEILDRPRVKAEIQKEVDSLMSKMLDSAAFRRGARLLK